MKKEGEKIKERKNSRMLSGGQYVKKKKKIWKLKFSKRIIKFSLKNLKLDKKMEFEGDDSLFLDLLKFIILVYVTFKFLIIFD